MDNIKTVLSLGIILAVVGTVLVYSFRLGNEPAPTVPTSGTLGALAGPDIPSPYLRWGGIATYRGATTLSTATTTPCAIQSPTATSTLLTTSVRVSTASSTATLWNISRSTNRFSTTTAITSLSLASGVQGTLSFVNATSSTDGATVFPPSTWLVWGAAGFVPAGTTKLNGTCQATWEAVS